VQSERDEPQFGCLPKRYSKYSPPCPAAAVRGGKSALIFCLVFSSGRKFVGGLDIHISPFGWKEKIKVYASATHPVSCIFTALE
jgi:hypothetical protein